MSSMSLHHVQEVEIGPVEPLQGGAFTREIVIRQHHTLPDGAVYQHGKFTITLFSDDPTTLRVEGDPAPLWLQKAGRAERT